ncbi:MAG: hypothetical protein JWM80_2552 [Cyanobacteria bacterium RYN_339]|nr:hypothetical protein [Cyanobacteria bacterium RYN_339]
MGLLDEDLARLYGVKTHRLNEQVKRAFVRMRRLLVSQDEPSRRLATLEDRVGVHDRELVAVLDAIRLLRDYPVPSKRKIGFMRPDEPNGLADHD